MDTRITKLQWDFLEANIRATKLDFYTEKKVALKGKSIRHQYIVKHKVKDITLKLGSTCFKAYVGIDAENVERLMHLNERLVSERDEIINRYDIGYIEFQKFLLDDKALNPLYREQLSLGLPLSSKQEAKAYETLKIEDEDRILNRKELIFGMSNEQRIKLNALTPEARQTVVARLVDGRILGVLDHVLDAAPDLFADRNGIGEVSENKLKNRLISYFQQEKTLSRQQRITKHQEEVNRLIQMVDDGQLEEVVLVSVASELLSEEQREYWRGHTSGRQKRELARHLLRGTNQHVRDIGEVGRRFKAVNAHISLGLPLTDQQLQKIEVYTAVRKD